MITTLPGIRRAAAFTLVELLTVIAIIAVLAAVAVGLTSAAKNARINSRAKTELQELQTAIEAYKADRNAFPPDNRLPKGAGQKVDPVVNQLYYELRGMEVVNGLFRCKGMSDTLDPDQIERVFGRRGFLNASQDSAEPARTYLDPKASAVKRVTVKGVEVELLVTPFDWPPGAPEPAPVAGTRWNPWRYVSTSPTNNTGGFDLWTEVYVGKDKRVFKNW